MDEQTGGPKPEEDTGKLKYTYDPKYRAAISACLHENWNFARRFATGKTYSNTPNPILQVHGAGVVGLPFGSGGADALVKVARQSSPHDADTMTDACDGGIWSIDDPKVEATNAAWSTFLTEAAQELFPALNIDFEVVQPRFQLCSLELYQSGACFPSHVSSVDAAEAFTTLLVILPSVYTGGAVRVSYQGDVQEYGDTPSDLSTTTLVLLYPGATLEVKPVTSGHRLALRYELLQTTERPRPALTCETPFSKMLLPLLQEWQEDATCSKVVPEKIVVLLEHELEDPYEEPLSFDALQGNDLVLVTLLRDLAEQIGLHVGLATLNHFVEANDAAIAESDSLSDDDEAYRDSGTDASVSSDACSHAEPWRSSTTVLEKLVDLKGNGIASRLDFHPDEAAPLDLLDLVESGDPREDGSYYRGHGSEIRWFASVLVLWPACQDMAVRFSSVNIKQACKEVESFNSDTSRAEKSSLVEFLLSRSSQQPALIGRAVAHAALVWKDSSLWTRAVIAAGQHSGCSVFTSYEPLWSAALAFGFENICSGLDAMLDGEKRNSARFACLDAVKEWSSSQNSPELDSTTDPWIASSTQRVFRTLQEPTANDYDHILLFNKAMGLTGILTLTDSILPRMKEVADGNFLREMAMRIASESRLGSSEQRAPVVSDLMATAIATATFHKEFAEHLGHVATASQRTFRDFFEDCLSQCNELCSAVVSRMAVFEACKAVSASLIVKDVMIPLLFYMVDTLDIWNKISPVNRPAFLAAFRTFVSNSLDHFPLPQPLDAKYSGRRIAEVCLGAIGWEGGDEFLDSMIFANAKKLLLSAVDIAALMKQAYSMPHPTLGSNPSPTGTVSRDAETITLLSKTYVTTLTSYPTPESICEVIERCARVKAFAVVAALFQRVFTLQALNRVYVTNVLVLALPKLCRLATLYNAVDGLRPVFQTILLAWIEKVQGPLKPALETTSLVNDWGCHCKSCDFVTSFFKSKGNSIKTTLRGLTLDQKNHVDAHLQKRKPPAFQVQVNGNGKTYNFQITTTKAFRDVMLLFHEKHGGNAQQILLEGIGMLKMLGQDEASLRRILGTHYERITSTIRFTPTPTTSQVTATGSISESNIQKNKTPPDANDDDEPPAKRQKV